jgi:predicted nucleotidyltransferase
MKLELRIVDFLFRNVGTKPSIHQISESLQEHYSLVHRVVSRLSFRGVIIRSSAGKALLCSLNLSSERTIAMLQLSEIERRDEFLGGNKELKLVVDDLLESLKPQLKNILAVVLYGSYARGTAAKGSDIDVLLLTRGWLEVEKATRSAYAKYGKILAPVAMTAADFRRQTDGALVGEIVKEHYVLHGVENFVRLVVGA